MAQILVIDDDKAVGRAIKTLLERGGSAVVHVEDGRSGMEAVARGSFDVVIVDIFMPGLDGIETIKALHRLKPDMPVIAVSGFPFRDGLTTAPDFLGMATELGAAHSLQKPFKPRDLLKLIESCLSQRQRPRSQKTCSGSS